MSRRHAHSLSAGLLAALLAAVPVAAAAQQPAQPASATAPANHAELARFFTEWRAFVVPSSRAGVPDYRTAAMAAKAAALLAWRARLARIDRTAWPLTAQTDYRLVEAELNGLDFELRVLKPWARDPTFYANIFADWSDVPVHEGPFAEPHLNLYAYHYPLSRADDRALTARLAAVPAQLAAAKQVLAGDGPRDLWRYGDRAFKDQSATLAAFGAGTLKMRTLDGMVPADLTGASLGLRRAIAAAKAATDDFAAWVAAEAPKKTLPAGVGKDNYNWYLRHVALIPYDWDAQAALLQRELDRAIASLRLEEVRNRALPPITPIDTPAAYADMLKTKQARFSDFLVATGLGPDAPWARAAIANQSIDYVPPGKRNFFSHVTALDPLPLMAHFTHWIDLARLREEPHASPIRAAPPLFNIFAARSEGFATAFEELTMQAGLYDDLPRGRELVWIMLANRAARGLASLKVQSNEFDLEQAGQFHAEWTPRGWSDPNSPLVGFEQLLYARQPGYGPSYIIGKLQLDHLIAAQSHADEQAGRPFDLAATLRRVMAAGIIPVGLAEAEVVPGR